MLVTSALAETPLPAMPPGELPEKDVRVQILESIPDQTSWDFKAPAPTETYLEPAFGFSAMPSKYSARGVRMDRGQPFPSAGSIPERQKLVSPRERGRAG